MDQFWRLTSTRFGGGLFAEAFFGVQSLIVDDLQRSSFGILDGFVVFVSCKNRWIFSAFLFFFSLHSRISLADCSWWHDPKKVKWWIWRDKIIVMDWIVEISKFEANWSIPQLIFPFLGNFFEKLFVVHTVHKCRKLHLKWISVVNCVFQAQSNNF